MMGQNQRIVETKYCCGTVTFHIRGNKIGVQTAHQFLLVQPYSQYQSAQVRACIDLIETGKIDTISKLIEACNGLVKFANSNEGRFYK